MAEKTGYSKNIDTLRGFEETKTELENEHALSRKSLDNALK